MSTQKEKTLPHGQRFKVYSCIDHKVLRVSFLITFDVFVVIDSLTF